MSKPFEKESVKEGEEDREIINCKDKENEILQLFKQLLNISVEHLHTVT